MNHPQPEQSFSERVRARRENLGLSQFQLADRAGIAPAVLSRVLSGTRQPTMDHLVRIAGGLETSVTELVAGTAVESVLQEWIPRADFEAAEKAKSTALEDATLARAEAKIKQSELDHLRRSSETYLKQIDELQAEVRKMQADLGAFPRMRSELTQLRLKVATLTAERDALEEGRAEFNTTIQSLQRDIATWEQAYGNLERHVRRVQIEAQSARAGQFTAGLFGAALGAILTSSTRRRS